MVESPCRVMSGSVVPKLNRCTDSSFNFVANTSNFGGVPRIADVDNLMDLLSEMDVVSDFNNTTLRINPEHIKMSPLPSGKIKSLRASYYFMGALLGRFGKAVVGFLVEMISVPAPLTNILRDLKP